MTVTVTTGASNRTYYVPLRHNAPDPGMECIVVPLYRATATEWTEDIVELYCIGCNKTWQPDGAEW